MLEIVGAMLLLLLVGVRYNPLERCIIECIIRMIYYIIFYLCFFLFFFSDDDDCVFDWAAPVEPLPAPGEAKNGEEKESEDFLRSAAAAAVIPANMVLNSSSSSASLQ